MNSEIQVSYRFGCGWTWNIKNTISGKKAKRKAIEEGRNLIKNIKKNGSCKICGTKENLTFHHRDPKIKKCNVNSWKIRYNVRVIWEEINKCDILCEKCHRKIHEKNCQSLVMGLIANQRLR